MSPASYQTAPPRGAAAKVAQEPGRTLGAAGGCGGGAAFGGQGLLEKAGHGVDVFLVLGEVAFGEGALGGFVFLVGLGEEALDRLVAAPRRGRGCLGAAG